MQSCDNDYGSTTLLHITYHTTLKKDPCAVVDDRTEREFEMVQDRDGRKSDFNGTLFRTRGGQFSTSAGKFTDRDKTISGRGDEGQRFETAKMIAAILQEFYDDDDDVAQLDDLLVFEQEDIVFE